METHPDGQYVIGPYGNRLTVADLPPARTKRWTSRRKAEVVAAVRSGLISLDEACNQYALTKAEFVNWQKSFEQHGLEGLKTKRIQRNRASARSAASFSPTLLYGRVKS